jgi:DNA repair exonuclease SbcCD ATPase subunit
MFSQESKLAVLESKLNIYEDLSREMLQKLEAAVDKISEGNSRIATILAKHDERIEQSIRNDELIVRMIDDLKNENKEESNLFLKRIEQIEENIKDLYKTKWMSVGIASAIAICITIISSLASGFFTPSEIQIRKNGHIHQQTDVSDTK